VFLSVLTDRKHQHPCQHHEADVAVDEPSVVGEGEVGRGVLIGWEGLVGRGDCLAHAMSMDSYILFRTMFRAMGKSGGKKECRNRGSGEGARGNECRE